MLNRQTFFQKRNKNLSRRQFRETAGTTDDSIFSERDGLLLDAGLGDDLKVDGVADLNLTLGRRNEGVVDATLGLLQSHPLV
jgi:hypothetical protein